VTASSGRLLIALDIDGTLLKEDGEITDAVTAAVAKVRDAGHEVMLATGRSVSMTLPILDRLGITPEYVVCSNGAITLVRDEDAPTGYRRGFVERFDPSTVLDTVIERLPDANYAVEDEDGLYRYVGAFPDGALGAASERVGFDELKTTHATRVVVISPEHGTEEFLELVEQLGLRKVSYNVGWTAWLDIAPDGVNKATALERVRDLLDIPRSNVVAMGDGRNDIEMLEWAAKHGLGVSMGQAPDDVAAVANRATASDLDDGAAELLASL
jgi:Cof subfamily protein (haloacid dehalogenase superfamily)